MFCVAISGFIITAQSQVSTPLVRKSLNLTSNSNSRVVISPSEVEINTLNNDSLIQVAKNLSKQCQSCRKEYYGAGIETSINIKESAQVFQAEDGALYLLTIRSETSFGMQFHFKKFKLPKGAQLHISNSDGSMELGAFTAENNHSDEKFATQYISGNETTLEYFEPNDSNFDGELVLERVIHVFKDIFSTRNGDGFETSGSCMIDVNCSEGIGFEDERKAIALISVFNPSTNMTITCTGFLINAANATQVPYLMTAAHCVDAFDKISFIW